MANLNAEIEKLTSKELSEILAKHGIKVSDRTILRYVRTGFIPSEYYWKERHGKAIYYFFKPEVIEYLLKKFSE